MGRKENREEHRGDNTKGGERETWKASLRGEISGVGGKKLSANTPIVNYWIWILQATLKCLLI